MKLVKNKNTGEMIEERRNGNSITYKAVFSILMVVIIGAGSWWFSSVYAAITEQSGRIYVNSDRISRLEVMFAGMEAQLGKIDHNVEKLLYKR